jgi:hypothetical protein|tara:strand:- start:2005 stop:2193 length:189 start_codon:yes stop_codon:yes gene_type:complete
MKINPLDKIIQIIREDAPTNNVGSGNIAGTREAGDDPPVRLKKKKKYIYMKGVRKTWKIDNG